MEILLHQLCIAELREKERTVVMRLAIFYSSFLLNLLSSASLDAAAAAMAMAKPNCEDKCGEVSIPYPFGIGPGCFLDEWYEVVCEPNQTPRLKKLDLEVLNITIAEDHLESKDLWSYSSNEIRANLPITYSTTNCIGTLGGMSTTLTGSSFYFSDGNMFMAVGCNMAALLNDTNSASIVGCKSKCGRWVGLKKMKNKNKELMRFRPSRFSECSGSDGCCQTTTIPPNLQDFNIKFYKPKTSQMSSGEECIYTSAFLVESSWFIPNVTDLLLFRLEKKVPVTLNWGIPNNSDIGIDLISSSDTYNNNGYSYVCYNNSYAGLGSASSSSIYCQCWAGFAGNPYLVDGCQGIIYNIYSSLCIVIWLTYASFS